MFDGVCNFCNGAVNFIIERDRRNRFKFAPLQSEAGQKLLLRYGLNDPHLDSVVLIEDGKAFVRSTAALRIAKHLDGAWSWFSIFLIVPAEIRDFFYRLFAKYRYRLFGKTETCQIPTPALHRRFLT